MEADSHHYRPPTFWNPPTSKSPVNNLIKCCPDLVHIDSNDEWKLLMDLLNAFCPRADAWSTYCRIDIAALAALAGVAPNTTPALVTSHTTWRDIKLTRRRLMTSTTMPR